MFIGEYNNKIDERGRMVVPADFRQELGEKFYITRGLDGCIFMLSQQEWQSFSNKLSELSYQKAKLLQRFFFSGACECEPDKLGRIVVPANLREYASLSKEVVIIGASNRAEIWSKKVWEEEQNKLSAEAISNFMEEIDF